MTKHLISVMPRVRLKGMHRLRSLAPEAGPAVCGILAAAVLALCPQQVVFAAAPPAPAPLTFAVGDQLQVSFYEPFNSDAKWAAVGQVREPGPSFYRHDELSGTYTVASDWTIALPVIGDVVVANRTAAEAEKILDQDFMKVVGHPGFVNISIAARTPLYVLGLVDNPGVYPFKPDITPLELIAMAGGYKTTTQNTQASIDAINAAAHQTAELGQLRDALAQSAVLQAETDNTPPLPPSQLIDLAGKSGADALVRDAQTNRQAVVQNQMSQVKALQSAVDAAQSIIVADQGRLKPAKDGVSLLLARQSSLESLSRDGLAAETTIEAAQAAALASQGRQQDVLAAVAADQHQLVLAKLALQDFTANNAASLAQQLADRQADIDSLTPQVTAGAEIVKLLTPPDAEGNSGDVKFSIVREGQVIAADISTGLQPGDVLRVETAPFAAAASVAASPQAASPASGSPQLAAGACLLATGCF